MRNIEVIPSFPHNTAPRIGLSKPDNVLKEARVELAWVNYKISI
ncbi:MAG TPA: hypothetical protein VF839_06920 [Clostridium sp.]